MTPRQAEAALRLWAEFQRPKQAGDTEQRGYRGKASFRAATGSGGPFKAEDPARPVPAEVQRQAEAVEAALRELAPTMRLILRLKYKNGLADEVVRTDYRLKMSEEDHRMMKGHALELMALRLSERRLGNRR